MSRFRISKIEEKIAYEIFRSCRLCGAGAGYKMPIVQNVDLDGDVPLTQKIRECVQIEVHQEDKMPPLICELCVDKVNDFYEFSEMCKQTNMKTRLRLGLPPQTMPRGAPNADDCILGVTETIFSTEDSNESIIKHKQVKLSKSKKETSDKVKMKSSENNRNSRSIKLSPEDSRRATRGSTSSPTNILTLRNRNSKDQKNVDQEEDILVTPKSKRGRERDLRNDLPVKRVKIEVSPSTSRSTRTSKSPTRSRTRSPPKTSTRSPDTDDLVCKVCKRTFLAKCAFVNHMKVHQNDTKNSRNKRSPPVPETKSKDRRREKVHARGKNDTKHKETHNCPCGREYLAMKNLRRHQMTCKGKKQDVSIDPILMSKIRPLQIRVARCDPILNKKYSISEVPQVFGLDKNCTYPYLRIKTEPNTGRDAMVRIEDEIKDVLYEADYIHWDSDTSTDEENETFIKKRKVSSLSTLSLKTIFSPRYLGRVRRKRRKVKTEMITENLDQNQDIFDDVDSFDDVHDLERINDSSFDQLFGNDFKKIASDVEDNDKEDIVNKEGNSSKEDNNLKENVNSDKDVIKENNDNEISKEENCDKEISKENSDMEICKDNSDREIRKENSDNEIRKGNHDKEISKENSDDEISEENSDKEIRKENSDKDISKEENCDKEISKENSDNEISEENSDKEISKEENSDKETNKEENSDKEVSLKKEENDKHKENNSLNNEENIHKYFSPCKEELSNKNQDDSINKEKGNNIKENSSNKDGINLKDKDELTERLIESNSRKDIISNILNIPDLTLNVNSNEDKIDSSEVIHKTDLNKINQMEVKNATIKHANINLILQDMEESKCLELNKDSIDSDIPVDIKEDELIDLLPNKEELITENDLLGERNLDNESIDNIFEVKDLNTDKKDLKNNKTENIADNIMKDILNKVNNDINSGDYLVNGRKNYEENVLDDQRLMDELDAQIGEDIMEKHLSLDDFSEVEEF
ncbi:Replicase polyprotein 1a [Papilio xuthus]|uniref:Replicase polyprotein 1a n=1 Tax=Papilio xuthus TaxID=66420 RepID=A0A194Q4C2_PAPXU|nr:Replicase polyprotein 1a [Papilio xuthus]